MEATNAAYDVVVLDVMLPGLSGYDVLRRTREAEVWTPVLMLTAKDGEYDVADALDLGADDYLVKPFSFVVLLARVRALQRRGVRARPAVLTAGDLVIDPAARTCTRGETEADHVSGASAPSVLSMESVRLTQLVDDLLALARIDAEPHHRRERVDLDDIVLSEIALVRPSAAVVLDASGVSAAQVRGDLGQLARTVRNVLDNAVRYADEHVTISLRTHSPHAVLVIEDDGPGIPAADRDRVRERFTRLDDARTRSIGGVGLGLAIVDEVVELHGGQLHIEDAGPGARIVITLPLADGAD